MSKLRQISKTREELLLNTINHFNSNNRSLGANGVCRYRGLNNTACAIGREINDKLAYRGDGVVGLADLFNLFPKRLQNMGIRFIISIQKLHDFESNWCINGLTAHGKDQVKYICNLYNIKIEYE